MLGGRGRWGANRIFQVMNIPFTSVRDETKIGYLSLMGISHHSVLSKALVQSLFPQSAPGLRGRAISCLF